jgi:hypothetical protein
MRALSSNGWCASFVQSFIGIARAWPALPLMVRILSRMR